MWSYQTLKKHNECHKHPNLCKSIRKWGKIGLNQSLTYIHPNPHCQYNFFYLPLYNSVKKKYKKHWGGICPNPCYICGFYWQKKYMVELPDVTSKYCISAIFRCVHKIVKSAYSFVMSSCIHDKWAPVIVARHVLRLQMKEWSPLWRVAGNMLNKKLWTADKVWSSGSSLKNGLAANFSYNQSRPVWIEAA